MTEHEETITVIIADDEKLQRQLIRSVIDWEKLGLQIIGEAENGKQVEEIVAAYQPNIIIMDINMPFLNGIEASKRIRQSFPDIQILILTAYDEFNFARDALHIGIIGYFLKPLIPDELNQGLIKAKNIIEQNHNQKKEHETLQKENFLFEKENFLLEKMTSQLESDVEADSRWGTIGINVQKRFRILKYLPSASPMATNHREETDDIILEIFPEAEMVWINNNLFIIIFSDLSIDEFDLQTMSLASSLTEKREFNTGCGLSAIHDKVQDIHIAYKEACIAAERVIPGNGISAYIPQSLHSFLETLLFTPDQLLSYLRSSENEKVLKQMHHSFQKFETNGVSYQLSFYFAMNMVVTFSLYLFEKGIDITMQIENEKEIVENLCRSGRMSEIEERLRDFFQSGFDLLQKDSSTSTKLKTKEACVFIEHNFSNSELGLNMIAKAIGINPCYLSSIFKHEIGHTLTKYVTKIRMDYALKLIRDDPAVSVTTLAEKVGYTDVFYFSKSFKKFFGASPSKLLDNRKRIGLLSERSQ